MRCFRLIILATALVLMNLKSVVSFGLDSNWNTLEYVNERFSNLTSRMYDSAHGTQIYYTSSNGRVYLVYPGNSIVLKGHWKARMGGVPTNRFVELCFKYGSNTYNPSTKRRGGNWACRSAAGPLRRNKEMYRGDILNLQKMNKLPAVLPRGRKLSISNVMKRFKIRGKRGRNLAR